MKETFSSLLDTARQAGEKIREATNAAGQAVADKTLHTIENWLEEFPRIESYGLQITHFAFRMGISPALDVELTGSHYSFPKARLDEILAENKSTTLTGMVFNAVKTTYYLHGKIASTLEEPLIVKIRLSITPEISVFIGKPGIA